MTECKDVNNNRIGKTIAPVEADWKREKLELPITSFRTNPLLGLDCMQKLSIHLNSSNDIKIQNITEDKDVTDLKKQ